MDDLFLKLCRLTDPVKTNGHKNLTPRYLLGKMGGTLTHDRRKVLKRELAKLDKMTKNIRDHRKNRIAHLDLECAIKAKALPTVIQGDLDDSLELLDSIMRELHLVLFNASTSYKEPAIAYGCDGEYLLRVLRDAHKYRDNNKN